MDENTTTEAPEAFDGRDAVRDAAADLVKQRAERGPTPAEVPEEEQPDPNLVEVRYNDGRPDDEPLTRRQAVRDLAEYRRAQREQEQGALADLLGEAKAEPQPEPQPQLEPEPQREPEPVQTPQAPIAQAQDPSAFVQQIRAVAAQEFSDIRSPEDLQRLAATDPQRFSRFQQLDLAHRVGEGAMREDQLSTAFKTYADEQDKLTIERIPELRGSPEERAAFSERALKTLDAHGFKRDELKAGYNGQAGFSLRDARVQEIIAKAARWDLQQERAKTKTAHRAPVPPPQRPGTSGGITRTDSDLDLLNSRLNKSGSLRDAVRLRSAQLRG